MPTKREREIEQEKNVKDLLEKVDLLLKKVDRLLEHEELLEEFESER